MLSLYYDTALLLLLAAAIGGKCAAEYSSNFFRVSSEPLPGYNANIGNGFLAFDCGCPSEDTSSSAGYIFVAGLYSGLGSYTPSHRAAINHNHAVYAESATADGEITNQTWTASLDIEKGLFTNSSFFWAGDANNDLVCQIDLEWIVHRQYKNLSLLHITTFNPLGNDCQFKINQCTAPASTDVIDIYNKTADGVTVTIYEVAQTEVQGMTPAKVIFGRQDIPDSLSAGQSVIYAATLESTSWDTDDATWAVEKSYAKTMEDRQQTTLPTPEEVEGSLWQLTSSSSWDSLLASHVQAWGELWESGIEIYGNDTIAASVNASLYYILSAVDADAIWSVSPGGLAKNSYNGHIFWDCETWMFPALVAFYPKIAGAFAEYRLQRQAAAIARANARGYDGAMMPWESAVTGMDVTPEGNIEGDCEIHVTADIPLSFKLLFEWTGDEQWLVNAAWPLIKECSTYFADRAICRSTGRDINGRLRAQKTCDTTSSDYNNASEVILDHYDGSGSYSCSGNYTYNFVQPPDESAGIVNSSVYTNAAAAVLLDWAANIGKQYGLLDTSDSSMYSNWKTLAQEMFIPTSDELDPALGWIHPEYAGYSGDPINQADTVLMQFPLLYPMESSIAFNDLQYYVSLTSIPGVTRGFYTGDSSYSIAYLNLFRQGLDSTFGVDLKQLGDNQFQQAFPHIDMDSFFVWHETLADDGGHKNFLTGAGGFLQNMIYGYGGLTLTTACSDDAEGGESGDAAGTSGSSDNSSSGSSSGDTDCVEREYLGVDPILPPGGVNAVKFRSLHFQSCVFNLWWDASNITVQAGSAGDAVLLSIASEDGDISGPIITIAKQDTSEVEPHATKVAAMGRAGSQPDAATLDDTGDERITLYDKFVISVLSNIRRALGGIPAQTVGEVTSTRLNALLSGSQPQAQVSTELSIPSQQVYIICKESSSSTGGSSRTSANDDDSESDKVFSTKQVAVVIVCGLVAVGLVAGMTYYLFFLSVGSTTSTEQVAGEVHQHSKEVTRSSTANPMLGATGAAVATRSTPSSTTLEMGIVKSRAAMYGDPRDHDL